MSPQGTELWKLSCRHFYTGTISHLLAVQGRKVLEHLYCHQLQQLPQSTQPWINLQNGCITTKLPGGECGERMYPTLSLIHLLVHLQVHLQMSSRSCKIYDRSSTKAKKSAIQIQCKLSRKCLILVQLVPVILVQLVH